VIATESVPPFVNRVNSYAYWFIGVNNCPGRQTLATGRQTVGESEEI